MFHTIEQKHELKACAFKFNNIAYDVVMESSLLCEETDDLWDQDRKIKINILLI